MSSSWSIVFAALILIAGASWYDSTNAHDAAGDSPADHGPTTKLSAR